MMVEGFLHNQLVTLSLGCVMLSSRGRPDQVSAHLINGCGGCSNTSSVLSAVCQQMADVWLGARVKAGETGST
jgi:hypothetical protein